MLMEWTTRHPAIGELLAALLRESSPIYVVGGVVRDMLMNRQPELNDLDIVIEGTALSQSKRIADKLGWAYYPLDEVRDIARIVFTAPGQPLICDGPPTKPKVSLVSSARRLHCLAPKPLSGRRTPFSSTTPRPGAKPEAATRSRANWLG